MPKAVALPCASSRCASKLLRSRSSAGGPRAGTGPIGPRPTAPRSRGWPLPAMRWTWQCRIHPAACSACSPRRSGARVAMPRSPWWPPALPAALAATMACSCMRSAPSACTGCSAWPTLRATISPPRCCFAKALAAGTCLRPGSWPCNGCQPRVCRWPASPWWMAAVSIGATASPVGCWRPCCCAWPITPMPRTTAPPWRSPGSAVPCATSTAARNWRASFSARPARSEVCAQSAASSTPPMGRATSA